MNLEGKKEMIKKYILTLALIVVVLLGGAGLSSQAVAQEANTLLLLDAVTATGDGKAKGIGFTTSKVTCHIRVTGTAPTSVDVNVKGSIDNTTYTVMVIGDHTYTIATAGTQTFSIRNRDASLLQGVYVSRVGGDGTTAVTLQCSVGGN